MVKAITLFPLAGKPWYDNVCVKGEGQELWYAQLRLMFSYGGKDLALVRWYDLQPGMDDDVLVQHGCQQLAWAVQGEGRRSAPWYSVSACFERVFAFWRPPHSYSGVA